MTIKQGLKFLDMFSFGCKYTPVFSIRQTYQIRGAIVMRDTIEMMNNPTFRKLFIMEPFPNINVFIDISCLISSMVITHANSYITIFTLRPAALPIGVFFPTDHRFLFPTTFFPLNNNTATRAMRRLSSDSFTAHPTVFRRLSSLYASTVITPSSALGAWFSTIYARMCTYA